MVSMSTGHTAVAFYGGADLIGWWRLDETNGTTAADSSGFAHTGFLTNGALFTNGMCGNGVFFDGINDFIRINDSDLLDFNGKSFTVALKIRTSKAGSQALVEKQHSGFSGLFLFALNRDNVAPGKVSVWTGSDWIDSTGAGLTDGGWHHVAVTFDGLSFRLYRDGLLDKTQVASANYVNTTLPLNLGRFVTGNTGWPYQGVMDEVRRYNRVLSGPEIAGLTNCPALPPAPLLITDGSSVAPTSLTLVRVSDGTVILSGQGQAQRVYRFQATSDLVTWDDLGLTEADGTGRLEFIDTTAGQFPSRFYRAVTP